MQLETELHFSLRQHGRGNHAGRAGTVGNVVVRLGEDRVVEGVEKLDAEFHVLTLRDVKNLAQSEIAGHSARSDQDVLPGVTEGVSCRQREAVRIEPEVGRLLAGGQVAVASAVGANQADGAGVRRIVAHEGREIKSAPRGEFAAQVPSSENQVSRAAGAEVMLTLSHWNLVVETRNPAELLIEIGGTSIGRYIVGVLGSGGRAADLGLVV